MSYRIPSRSAPAGCVFGLFALFFYAIAAIGIYGLWLLLQTDESSRGGSSLWFLVAAVFLGITVGTIFLRYGLRLFRRMDHKSFDPHDPDEPMMKF